MATPPTPGFGVHAPSGSAGMALVKRLGGLARLPHARRYRSTAHRVALAVFAGLATMIVLLALDGAWAGRAMFRGVSGARSQLAEGAVAAVTGDPAASVPRFEEAADWADSALGAAGHPSIELASFLPWVGDNLEAIEAIAEASRRSADAGVALSEAAEALGWHDLRLPAAKAIGDVDLAAIEDAAPAFDDVGAALESALTSLDAVDPARLLGPVATAYEDASETLRRRANIAKDTQDLIELLPGFLGAGTERRYLLAMQTLGRPQGTGGEVDLIGVLTANDGVLALDAPLAPAGPSFAAATATVDTAGAADDLLAAAREAHLGDLDGVVLTDSVWLADALWTTGSVDVSDRDLPVNSDQALEVLEREVFEQGTAASAAARRADVSTAVVESYLAGRPATEAFAAALARDVAERHLVIVATRARERRIIDRLGAGGAGAPSARQVVAVTWNTAVDNHAAVFVRRDVSHRVMLRDDGSAVIRTVVNMVNRAPDDPPSALLGFALPATVEEPAGVNPVGGWAADVGVLLPRKPEGVTAETSVPSETETAKIDGRAMVIGRLAADPGDSMALIVSYRVSDAGVDDGVYRLMVVPQPAWPEGVVRLQIDAPPDSTIVAASDDLEAGSTSAKYVGTPTKRFSVWVRFA